MEDGRVDRTKSTEDMEVEGAEIINNRPVGVQMP